MCGIAGILNRDHKPVDVDNLAKMLSAIRHRGPDDCGMVLFDPKRSDRKDGVVELHQDELTKIEGDRRNCSVALGHNRLSILDLSERGHQPMSCGDGSLWIVHNGEIYNYLELKEELFSKGYEFKSNSDTEVILNSYREWGCDCLKKFNGMWAFAIWDRRKMNLFCARDRFGIKPFYYYFNGRLLLFASEIKAILAAGIPAMLNMETLLSYLIIGITHHTKQTFLRDIFELLPGHYMSYDSSNANIEFKQYYALPKIGDSGHTTSLELELALNQSVKFRLRSDVPVGTCLSGGIDSSTIASIASNMYRLNSNTKFSAITAQSEDKRKDESQYARIVAEHCDLSWHTVKPTFDDFVFGIEECLRIQEEPIGGPSVFMQYCVMKKAKELGLKVMLDGQGGDETMLGYERYYPAFFFYLLKNGQISDLLKEYWLASRHSKLGIHHLFSYIIYFLTTAPRKFVLKNRLKFIESDLMVKTVQGLDALKQNFLSIEKLQKTELTKAQLRHLLHYEDRNSMAHSIEARVPFVDHFFVETALKLKPEDKIRKGFTKNCLREIANKVLPREIAWRRDKIGFEAPTNLWLKNFHPKMMEAISKSNIIESICSVTPNVQVVSPNVAWRLYNIALWELQYNVLL